MFYILCILDDYHGAWDASAVFGIVYQMVLMTVKEQVSSIVLHVV